MGRNQYISENPLKICAYAPYLMELLEKVIKTKYQMDVKHVSFRPKMPKHRREPSPHRYSEVEDDMKIEEEEGQRTPPQQQQPSPTAPTGTGLTSAQDWSDRSRPEQHRRRYGSSPVKKLINLFVRMCKSQRDIEVEQQRQWRASKKERDSVKMMHNAMNLQPPRSPISPSPPEAEIPSVEDRVQGYVDSGYFEQYGHIFYPDVSGPSHAPPSTPPGEGVFGAYSSHFYGGVGPSHEPSRPSEADQFAARISDAVFGHH